MHIRFLLTTLLISLCLQSCASQVAEPVFLVSEDKQDPKDTPPPPPIHLQAKPIKAPNKNQKVYEAPELTEQESEKGDEKQNASKDVLLAKISTDYSSRTYDLLVTLDEKQQVSAIKTKSNKGKIKNYPLDVLNREVVLVKAVGVSLVTLLCKNFNQNNGCPIEIEYPSNVTYGKFLRFQADLKQHEGSWRLESRGREFTSMHLVAKKLFGLLIGVERIELR